MSGTPAKQSNRKTRQTVALHDQVLRDQIAPLLQALVSQDRDRTRALDEVTAKLAALEARVAELEVPLVMRLRRWWEA